MSIHIVDSDLSYNNLQNNTLLLNSSTDSNIIRLRTGLENTYINYENKYDIGLSNNDFVINSTNNNKLFSLNDNNINIYKSLKSHFDVNLYDKLYISSNKVSIHNNFDVVLDNNFTFDVDGIMTINSSSVTVNSNVYVNNGTLFVNNISPLGEANMLSISGASFDSGIINSLLFEENIKIYQNSTHDSITLDVRRSSNNTTDLISFSSFDENEINSASVYNNLFSMNNKGFVGFGIHPTSIISLSAVNDTIIDFTGNNYGDTMLLTSNGNLGIGTDNPSSRLHIKRTDDYPGTHIRNNPILKIDMEYAVNNNISNIYISDSFSYYDSTSDPSQYVINCDLKYDIGNVNKTTLYINNSVNDEFIFQEKYDNDLIGFDSSNFNILQDSFYFIENGVGYNLDIILPYNRALYTSNIYMYKTFESNVLDLYIHDNNEPNFIPGSINSQTTITVMINNRSKSTFSFDLIRSDLNTDYLNTDIRLHFYNKKPSPDYFNADDFKFEYIATEKYLIPAPDMIYMSKENIFVSSFSSDGTLSIGSPCPSNKDYKLYIDGNSFIDTLNVNNLEYISIGTFASSNIEVENLNFNKLNTEFLKIDSNLIESTVQTKIITNSTNNNANNINESLVITNNDNLNNPAVVIDGKEVNSHLILKNNLTLYSLNTSNESFEITYGINPVNIVKHWNNTDILSLGKNGYINITDNNISIGVPNGILNDQTNEFDEEMVDFFKNNLENEPTVTIFGNVRFADKNNKTLMEIKNDNVYIYYQLVTYQSEVALDT